MTRTIVFDIETTLIPAAGVLPKHVHMVAWHDVDCGTSDIHHRDNQVLIEEAWRTWCFEDVTLIGHNIARFDIPVMEELTGIKFPGRIVDTLVWSRMVHGTTILGRSIAMRRNKAKSVDEQEEFFPKRLLAAHSLEAWGHRLHNRKGQHAVSDPGFFFAKLSPEMIEYCRQDVALNVDLYQWLKQSPARPGWPLAPQEQIERESRLAWVLAHQERNGIGFNVEAARELEQELLVERAELAVELRRAFPGWYKACPGQKGVELSNPGEACYTVYKERSKWKGEPERGHHWGGPATKIEWVEFNPASGEHRAVALRKYRDWVPNGDEYTATGMPETSERVLSKLDYPEIPTMLRYLWVNKRLGQLSEGSNAWLDLEQDGVIRGSINVVGTRTSRCTHQRPNMAQVPREKAFRALFMPTRPGWVQVGADASGLELRCLAHRLAPYDNGETAELVTEGDVHSAWQKLTQLHDRNSQKTFTYAMLYGAGPAKLGSIVIADALAAGERVEEKFAIELGAAAKDQLLRGLPALGYLLDAVSDAFHNRRWLKGLDGRTIPMQTEHGGLNDLLQSDGAIIMKYALRIFWETEHGEYDHEYDWAFMANVHDEVQMEACNPELAKILGEDFVDSIIKAGEDLGVRCPLDGEYKIGATWAETH